VRRSQYRWVKDEPIYSYLSFRKERPERIQKRITIQKSKNYFR